MSLISLQKCFRALRVNGQNLTSEPQPPLYTCVCVKAEHDGIWENMTSCDQERCLNNGWGPVCRSGTVAEARVWKAIEQYSFRWSLTPTMWVSRQMGDGGLGSGASERFVSEGDSHLLQLHQSDPNFKRGHFQ